MSRAKVIAASTLTRIGLTPFPLFRRPLLSALRRYPTAAGYILSGALVLLAAATAAGLFKDGERDAFPADASLAWNVALHALGGCVLALLQWCAGCGLARLVWRGRYADLGALGLLGVPLGILVTTLGSAIALAVPGGPLIATALLAASVASLFGSPALKSLRDVRTAAMSVAALSAFSGSFGCWLALHWHGPTAVSPGFPSGDLTYYASSIWAIAAQPFRSAYLPLEGLTLGYWNLRLPAIGAALSRFVSLDGFLFMTATVPAMGLTGLGLALKAFHSTIPRDGWRPSTVAFVACALVAAGRYPYWLAESPPVAELGMVTIATWFYVRNTKGRPVFGAISFGLSMVSTALSKVVAAVALGGFTLSALLQSVRSASTTVRIVLWIVVLSGLTYAAVMLVRYLPFYLSAAALGPESWVALLRWKHPLVAAWPFIARDVSAVLLAALAFRVLPPRQALSLAAACAVFLAYSFVMRANFLCVMIVMALVFAECPKLLERTRLHSFITIALALPAMLLLDPTGWSTGVVWTVIIVFICMFSLPTAARVDGAATLARFTRPIAAAWAITAVLVLTASARGTIALRNEFMPNPPELTPEVRELWSVVRTSTPRDALIFTDQTGEDENLLGGWNTYVMHGQRQVFVSDLTQSGMLRTNREAAALRLQMNARVLDGDAPPSGAGLRGRYSAYYAAVSRDRPLGRQWERIQTVGNWALYIWRDSRRQHPAN